MWYTSSASPFVGTAVQVYMEQHLGRASPLKRAHHSCVPPSGCQPTAQVAQDHHHDHHDHSCVPHSSLPRMLRIRMIKLFVIRTKKTFYGWMYLMVMVMDLVTIWHDIVVCKAKLLCISLSSKIGQNANFFLHPHNFAPQQSQKRFYIFFSLKQPKMYAQNLPPQEKSAQ